MKLFMRLVQVSLLMLGLFINSYTNAGGLNAANNPVMNPCIQQPHLSGCGANGSQAATQVIRIPSRYGAVAYDADQGIVGATDNNLKSLRAAKKEAMQRCIGYGGSKSSCKVVAATRNGCNALALGTKKKW